MLDSNLREESFEYGLPEYLQHDLDCYKKALAGEPDYADLLDCYWCELYGSINSAQEDLITVEHADYLRKKFLYL